MIDYRKDDVCNISTGLMALRDVAGSSNIPINVYVDDLWIHVTVGFGTPCQRQQSFYVQDMYKYIGEYDTIFNWIEEAIKSIMEG